MSVEGSVYLDHLVITRRWPATAGRFEEIAKLLKGPEAFAGKRVPCRLQITDGPQGQITWKQGSRSKTLSVVYACTSARADRIYEQLEKAASLAQGWGKEPSATEDSTPVQKL
jgi:hypothetical protein